MYLRHTTARKNGKTHSDWPLVRSVRRGRRVVQETVAQLGELDGQGRARAGISSTTKSCRLACGSNGRGAPNGTTGRVTAKAAICCAPLWKTLEQWQSRAGLGNSPRPLLQELAAITSTDVILPTTAPGRELRLRCVVRPDRA